MWSKLHGVLLLLNVLAFSSCSRMEEFDGDFLQAERDSLANVEEKLTRFDSEAAEEEWYDSTKGFEQGEYLEEAHAADELDYYPEEDRFDSDEENAQEQWQNSEQDFDGFPEKANADKQSYYSDSHFNSDQDAAQEELYNSEKSFERNGFPGEANADKQSYYSDSHFNSDQETAQEEWNDFAEVEQSQALRFSPSTLQGRIGDNITFACVVGTTETGSTVLRRFGSRIPLSTLSRTVLSDRVVYVYGPLTAADNRLGVTCQHAGRGLTTFIRLQTSTTPPPTTTPPPMTCIQGSVRLVGRSNQFEGRVEVCNNGQWGTVCDDGFSTVDANVVCRQLGFLDTGARSQCCSRYGRGTGNILLDNVQCLGNETSLLACRHPGIGVLRFCSHSEDVGVVCQPPVSPGPAECSQGQIRLANSPTITEGLLEVCDNGHWGTVCDDRFDNQDAMVACRQLGFPSTGARSAGCCARYGPGNGSIALGGLSCNGTEASLFDCPQNNLAIYRCSHFSDAGVVCRAATTPGPSVCRHGNVRLVGGSNQLEGLVEVCNNGQWNPVCSRFFGGTTSANVVCRQLGFLDTGASRLFGSSAVQSNTSTVLISSSCAGNETSLFNCPPIRFPNTVRGCTYLDTVTIRCLAPIAPVPAVCAQGEIRLVGGSNELEGRVEVCENGQWGTVCDNSFGSTDANVACRQLGYSGTGARSRCCARYGQGNGSIALGSLFCTGRESSLFDCPNNPLGVYRCRHSEDVGIICRGATTPPPIRCIHGDVRLVGGFNQFQGRVEVCANGQWGTVCDDDFGTVDANVVCRQLGFADTGASVRCCSGFGRGSGRILLDNVGCFGNESSILNCNHLGIGVLRFCSHSEDVGVTCQRRVATTPPPMTCIHRDVRLVGGSNQFQGRVEVCANGRWGTVCDDGFNSADARVVCRQLGFSTNGATAQCCARYGRGNGSIVLDDLTCSGSESSLFTCRHRGLFSHNCGHSEDVGVTCQGGVVTTPPPTVCSTGAIRLVGGANQYQGRVEVCNLFGQWGTVCDDGFNNTEASVVCQQLGFPSRGATVQPCAAYGRGTGPIVLDDVSCFGFESHIFACRHQPFNVHDCGHEQDVGVTCQSPPCTQGSIQLVGGSNQYQGRVEVCNNGLWGTVCDDDFGTEEANVVCRQLGFSGTGSTVQACHSSYGLGTGRIVLDNVVCSGRESSIFNCRHRGLNVNNCGHDEDVGVTCQAGGSNCSRLTAPFNGRVSFSSSSLTAGTTASYSCFFGYRLIGISFRTCLSSGSWTGFTPFCVRSTTSSTSFPPTTAPGTCFSLPFPTNGRISYSSISLTPGTTARYSCSFGYRLIGSSVRFCISGSFWSRSAPFCVRSTTSSTSFPPTTSPATCPRLFNPINGFVTFSSLTPGSSARYFCNSGYRLIGSSFRFCTGSSWTGSAPFCVRSTTSSTSFPPTTNSPATCPRLFNPPNGFVSFSSLTPGSSARYSCNFGYRLIGSSVRTCFSSGSWSGITPFCVISTTSLPPINASIEGDLRLVGGSRRCEGRLQVYVTDPRSSSNSLEWFTACDRRFTTEAIRTACRQLGCPTGNPRRESISRYGGRPRSPHSYQAFGFTCSGQENKVVNCTYTGAFCDISNGRISSIIGMSCNEGVEPTVAATQPPGPEGPFDGELRLRGGQRSCEGRLEVYIPFLSTWAQAVYKDFGPEEVMVACRELGCGSTGTRMSIINRSGPYKEVGYQCNGNEARLNQCRAVPTFSKNSRHYIGLRCGVGASCPRLLNPSNGRVSYSGNGTRLLSSTATFSCNPGYTVFGPSVLTCVSPANGAWSGAPPICRRFFGTATPAAAAQMSEQGCIQGDIRQVSNDQEPYGHTETCKEGMWRVVCREETESIDGELPCVQLVNEI